MAKQKEEKTNVMRVLEQKGVAYTPHTYPTDGSIEYVKDFQINGEFVKVAVRLSGGGTLYARSLYVLNHNRVINFIQKGTLKRV